MNKMANHKKTNEKTLPFAGLLFLMLVFGGGIRQVGYAFDSAEAKDALEQVKNKPDNASNQKADSLNQEALYYLPF